MSEPIPESIPTSQDPRSQRPTKRLALTPSTAQAAQLSALFAKPDREITLPTAASQTPRNAAPPPEIVANVQGSSAGAGSGEFHVYKASRRREYERLRLMDEEVRREKEEDEFERSKEERRRKDEGRTGKNRARRERLKAKKMKSKETGDETQVGQKEEGGAENTSAVSRPEAIPGEGGNAQLKDIGMIIHDDY